jgi:hypothetical protein
MMTHPDGTKCIWLDGEWFVPQDAGGEGYTCPQEHPWSFKGRTALAQFADWDINGVIPHSEISNHWYHYGLNEAQESARRWLREPDFPMTPLSYAASCERLVEELEDLPWETNMSVEDREKIQEVTEILRQNAERLRETSRG